MNKSSYLFRFTQPIRTKSLASEKILLVDNLGTEGAV